VFLHDEFTEPSALAQVQTESDDYSDGRVPFRARRDLRKSQTAVDLPPGQSEKCNRPQMLVVLNVVKPAIAKYDIPAQYRDSWMARRG
jgi:hypothetical protein